MIKKFIKENWEYVFIFLMVVMGLIWGASDAF